MNCYKCGADLTAVPVKTITKKNGGEARLKECPNCTSVFRNKTYPTSNFINDPKPQQEAISPNALPEGWSGKEYAKSLADVVVDKVNELKDIINKL